jgi:hypothetical protein
MSFTSTLTVQQKITLFYALQVPYSVGYTTIDAMGTLGAQVLISEPTQLAAKTLINDYLNSLGAADQTEFDALEVVLKDQLDQLTPLMSNAGQVAPTGGSSTTGVTFTWQEKKQAIIDQIKTIVPFYKYHEVLARRQGESVSIPMVR